MKKGLSLLLSVALMMSAFSVTYTQAQVLPNSQSENASAPPENKRLWNLKDVDIRSFIHVISEETDKNFVIDPEVKGKVTFISSQPLTREELYQAFLSVLIVNGFAALPDGKVIKIVPDKAAAGLGSPIYNERMRKEGDAMAVSVVGVKYVPVNELAAALNQFITPAGHIAAYAPSNTLIIADRAGNITNLTRLVNNLDQQQANRIQVVRLKHARAKELVETIKSVLEQKGQNSISITSPNIAADERTNSILISGGMPEQGSQILSVIKSLDTPNASYNNITEVIYLKHLHAERAATIVNGLIQNYLAKHEMPAGAAGAAQGASSSGGSNSQQPASNLFNTSMGSQGGGFGSQQQGPMFSTNSALYTSNAPDNDISTIVQSAPKSGSISPAVQWESSTNSLIVTAPVELLRQIKRVIAKLDIRRPQVLIEAVIAEVSLDRQKELGIQWDPSGHVSFQTSFLPILPISTIGTNGSLATVSGGNNTVGQGISVTYKGDQIRFLVSALEQDNTSNVIATPNLVTLDNEPAQIKIGSKISFSTAQIQNNPTGGNPFSFFDREDVGLVLTIQPQITPNGSVKLLIQQELSAIIPGTQSAGGNPDTTERFVRTTVMADNGKVLVLAGLLQDEWHKDTSKVPFLGNIPLVGVLFRDQAKINDKTNLMIFLRPTILYSDKDDSVVSGGKYEFLRQSQLNTDTNNPYRDSYDAPALPVLGREVQLPPPFMV